MEGGEQRGRGGGELGGRVGDEGVGGLGGGGRVEGGELGHGVDACLQAVYKGFLRQITG